MNIINKQTYEQTSLTSKQNTELGSPGITKVQCVLKFYCVRELRYVLNFRSKIDTWLLRQRRCTLKIVLFVAFSVSSLPRVHSYCLARGREAKRYIGTDNVVLY